jgi:hypothetical protein
LGFLLRFLGFPSSSPSSIPVYALQRPHLSPKLLVSVFVFIPQFFQTVELAWPAQIILDVSRIYFCYIAPMTEVEQDWVKI